MTTDELISLIDNKVDEKVEEIVTKRLDEFDIITISKQYEYFTRKLEALATEIKILKEGGNI